MECYSLHTVCRGPSQNPKPKTYNPEPKTCDLMISTNHNTNASQARADLWARRSLRTARVLTIYGLLAGGAVIFSLPFVWMIGTSAKVDREMYTEEIRLFPMRPIPAEVSPYLDDRFYEKPDHERYERVRPVIKEALYQREIDLPEFVHNRDRVVEIITPGIYERLWQTMPRALWLEEDERLFEEIRARMDDGLIRETVHRVLRSLTFGAVRVRSFDLQEIEVTADRPISEFWEIKGDVPARFVDRLDAESQADLLYDFRSERRGRLTLERTIELPFDAERLYRVQMFIRPDDSWHPLRFYVEKGGALYKGRRPEYLGDFQWGAVTLQEYGPDDESTKIRLWIPYTKVDEGPQYESRPDRVKVRIEMEENTAFGAWWAKAQRNYRGALDYIPFWRYTATSIFLVALNIIGNIISCSLVAYAFARLHWPGRNISFGVMLSTLMIPPQITMIPFFLIIKEIGWYNTLYPLWVISFFGNAFNIFLLRQFMKGIPRDLEDAAKIDGCNFIHVYWYVILPLIKPTLAVISIFTFMAVWNDFMGPLIFLSDQRLYPLSLGLYAFHVQAGGDLGMMMAGSLLMTLPVILIFFFAQKYFIQGVTLTGMKG